MHRNRLTASGLSVASCVLLLLASRAAAQDLPTVKPEDVGISSEKVEKLPAFMQSLVDDGEIVGGVTMMARHGKVAHLKPVGMADREAGRPMQTDAIFRIASMSKPITSVAIMMLLEQGRLDLDDPVSEYIPEFRSPKVLVSVDPLKTEPAEREITIRHLLTHTAGLGYTQTEGVGPIYRQHGITTGLCTTDRTLEAMMKTLARLPLKFNPGQQYQYGMSTDVLGRVIEVASGLSFDRFIREQICVPLGMDDTFFYVPAEKQSRLVPAYVPSEDGLRILPTGERMDYKDIPLSSDYHLRQCKYLSGGGGLCSTASDYMRFCQMLLNGGQLNGSRLLREATVDMMTTNQVGDLLEDGGFGFGFGVKPATEDTHEQLRASYNWGGAWVTQFRISPRGDWILITMSQRIWRFGVTPNWLAEYERIAAEAVLD